jgi:CheY-like chemotaxis protein
MKIPIVEDEVLIAMYLELLVEDFGHQVCAVAASAAEAIALASLHLPDVALMGIFVLPAEVAASMLRRRFSPVTAFVAFS